MRYSGSCHLYYFSLKLNFNYFELLDINFLVIHGSIFYLFFVISSIYQLRLGLSFMGMWDGCGMQALTSPLWLLTNLSPAQKIFFLCGKTLGFCHFLSLRIFCFFLSLVFLPSPPSHTFP